MMADRLVKWLPEKVFDHTAPLFIPMAWFLLLLPWSRNLGDAASFELDEAALDHSGFDVLAPFAASWRRANTTTPLLVWWSSDDAKRGVSG